VTAFRGLAVYSAVAPTASLLTLISDRKTVSPPGIAAHPMTHLQEGLGDTCDIGKVSSVKLEILQSCLVTDHCL